MKYKFKLVYYITLILRIYYVRINSHNKYTALGAILFKTKIRVYGINNIIIIDDQSVLKRCNINIVGSDNIIRIGRETRLKDVEFYIEDDNNSIIIGEKTTIAGTTHLACIEGTSISIGTDCMFSKDITIRTGDSHSIIDSTNNRINPSKDVYIGNHVWVGNKVIITKGSMINDNSIIGTGSIVPGKSYDPGVIITGVPGKEVKRNINWLRERI